MSKFDIDFDAVETFTRFFADDGSQLDWRILGANCSPRKLRGTLLQQKHALQAASVNGAEVFFMVNETDGSGQTKQNVTNVRALFADLDDTPLGNIKRIPIEPHLVVETSPGKFHVYWLVQDVPISAFSLLQRQLAAIIGSDPAVSDLPRIMRVPGTWHHKAKPFRARIDQINAAPRLKYKQIKSVLAGALQKSAAPAAMPAGTQAAYSLDRGLPDGSAPSTYPSCWGSNRKEHRRLYGSCRAVSLERT